MQLLIFLTLKLIRQIILCIVYKFYKYRIQSKFIIKLSSCLLDFKNNSNKFMIIHKYSEMKKRLINKENEMMNYKQKKDSGK